MPKKQQGRKSTNFISGEEQSKRRKRLRVILVTAIIVVVVAALGGGGWGYYATQVKPFSQAAVRVNDVTHDMGYYINMMELYYGDVSASVLSEYEDYGDQEIEQFAGYIEQHIIQNEIIKQGSAAFGFEVDRSEAEDLLKEAGEDITDERIDVATVQELLEMQVPSVQQQYSLQVMLLKSESSAREAIARVQAGQAFDEVANEVSLLTSSDISGGELGWVTPHEADLTVGSTALGAALSGRETGLSAEPVHDDTVTKTFGYWVIQVAEKQEATDNTTSDKINIKGILVGSEEEAEDVIVQLNDGADIDELAKEVSQLSYAAENGAELGWITWSENLGNLLVLFDLPVGGISEPIGDNQVQTSSGYWVINIVEQDANRELTTSQKNALQDELLEKLTAELEADPDYVAESLITEEMRIFAIDEVVNAQGKGSVFIRDASLPDGGVGVEYSVQLLTYGEQNGNTWSIADGDLPRGLSLDSDTGVISGTPEIAGGSSVTVRVSNNIHHWEEEFFLLVHLPITISTTSLPDGEVGTSYIAMMEAFSDIADPTWSLIDGSFPDGINFGPTTGAVYGTPTVAGTFDFTVQVDDGYSQATQSFTVTIAEASDTGASDNVTSTGE